MDAFPRHSFWDFSLAVYARPGVAPACLALQERRGIDVNLLLFCCWSALSGRAPLTPGQLGEALARAEEWAAAVVRPLRAVRQALKARLAAGLPPGAPPGPVGALRRDVKASELAAEHVEQLILAAALPGPDGPLPERDPTPTARANIDAYLVAMGILADAADEADLGTILAAVAQHPRP